MYLHNLMKKLTKLASKKALQSVTCIKVVYKYTKEKYNFAEPHINFSAEGNFYYNKGFIHVLEFGKKFL